VLTRSPTLSDNSDGLDYSDNTSVLSIVQAKEKLMANDCSKGLDDRCRDEDGSIRRKRGDTLIGTLREEYGENFAAGVRADMRLDTLLERTGATSLSEYLRTWK
jgi:hypothetical protein